MSTETKLTRNEEGESVDNTKYRGMIGLWYPKGSDIETIVYADSDHAGNYVDRKSTSGVCTFMGCCLTSWFSKKQTALAISTTEAEYVSARKARQQALWMKQALVDYGLRLDDIPIMCDNKGAIDLKLLQVKEMADQDTPPPTITAMKIPIIKKGEYDIWREQSSPPVPKTAKQLAARRNQERIKSILLLAISNEYLLKFHNVPDAKSL
ncbi:hypothetical protein Tco_1177312 [Tanacetum coccineum]